MGAAVIFDWFGTLASYAHASPTNYETVLAESREGLARYSLRGGTLRTTEVGDLLGYDDTNSFQRTAL